MRASTLAAALVLALASPVAVQAQDAAPATAPAPAADPADVATPEALITAVYDVISGDAGVARDWDRFRSLFHPAARLIPSGVRPDGTIVARSITPEEYITLSGPQLEGSGFHEREIAATTERYGSMVHVFSTYEARRASTDAEPFMRGINSFQLFFDGTRWWVLSIYWRAEDDSLPIPEKYLP
ncbi:hypothetical protein [Brevundimonas sp.]|uniref:hypothetical protein n=1 Tax=Brevundimonas sp. TaxID=1871086 RepID=UPI0035127BD2